MSKDTEYFREYYRKNVEKRRIQTALVRAKPEAREKKREYNRKYQKENAERIRAYKAAQPEKTKAREKLRYAVRSGKLRRLPCDICGEPETHGHHNDYTKPLEVVWLCKTHHAEVHGPSRRTL